MSYIKLKDIQAFRVTGYNKSFYQMWDEGTSQYVKSDEWVQGMDKKHQLSIYNGTAEDNTLEVSNSQMGQMLSSVLENGQANIINREFTVKTNGKTGKEIRYFINAFYPSATQTPKTPENASQGQITGNNSDSIPPPPIEEPHY